MFDFPSFSLSRQSGFEDALGEKLPAQLLIAVADLSDFELDALMDDLDFYAFTGLASGRISALLPTLQSELEAA